MKTHSNKSQPAPAPRARFAGAVPFLLAVAAAGMIALAMPRLNVFVLAWCGLVPLLAAIGRASPVRAFFIGWLFGGLLALLTSYWVFHALYVNGNAGLAVSLLFMLVLIGAGVGLYFALFALGAARVLQSGAAQPMQALGIAALWIAVEYVRAHLFGGVPWELLGHTQYRWLRFIQTADLTGVYGLSFVIVLANCCLYQAVVSGSGGVRERVRVLMPAVIAVAAVMIYGTICLRTYAPEESDQDAPLLAVIQGSVPQNKKWRKEHRDAIFTTHLDLTRQALAQGAHLVVWPETAITSHLQEGVPESLTRLLRDFNAEVLIGAPRYTGRPGSYTFYNCAFLLTRAGIAGVYDKRHLLPFGEYFPLGALDVLKLRYAAPRQYSPGTSDIVLDSAAGRLGPLICYESIYPVLARRLVAQGAGLLVNISNDAWFGRTNAHYQHFSMAVFRAVELRRPLVRAANTGISAFVRPDGSIAAQLAPFTEGVLIARLAPGQTQTLYSRWGDWFALVCMGGAVVTCLSRRRRSFRKKTGRNNR